MLGFNVSHYHLRNHDSIFLHNIINKNVELNRDIIFGIPKDMDAILDCNPIMTEFNIYSKLYNDLPGSKFIFLDREFNAWYISMIKHALKNHYINDDYIYDRDWFFEQHVRVKAEILAFFKDKENFLHLNLCEEPTWGKLCAFINEKIPKEPFPKLNSIPVDYDYLLLVLKAKNYKYSDWDAAFRNAITDNWAKVGQSQTTQDKPYGRWDSTLASTMAKGKELGILPKVGETEGQYRERLKQGGA
jgi:hypothetical protein